MLKIYDERDVEHPRACLPARTGDAMTATFRTVSSGGVDLAVFEEGDPGAPAVLLVHGYPDTHGVWDDVAAALAPAHRVIRYDVRGAGRSGCPAGLDGYRLDRLADDLFAVIAAVGQGHPVHLAAHDWGSIQSWHAVTDPRAAGRIASYTTISGPCLDHVAFWVRRRLARPTPRHVGQLARQWAKSWYIGVFLLPFVAPAAWRLWLARRWPRVLRLAEGVTPRPGLPQPTLAGDAVRGIGLYRANMGRRHGGPRERYADVPVQVITLTRDRYVSPALTEGLEHWAPRLTRRSLEATHWSALTERGDTVAAMMRDFAAGADGDSGG